MGAPDSGYLVNYKTHAKIEKKRAMCWSAKGSFNYEFRFSIGERSL